MKEEKSANTPTESECASNEDWLVTQNSRSVLEIRSGSSTPLRETLPQTQNRKDSRIGGIAAAE